jgi:hypothetical protein
VLDMERAQTEQAKRAQILEDTQGKALENLASAFQTGQALGVGMQ